MYSKIILLMQWVNKCVPTQINLINELLFVILETRNCILPITESSLYNVKLTSNTRYGPSVSHTNPGEPICIKYKVESRMPGIYLALKN